MILQWISLVQSVLNSLIAQTQIASVDYINIFWQAFEDCHIAPDSEELKTIDAENFDLQILASETSDLIKVWTKIVCAPLTRFDKAPAKSPFQRWRRPLMMTPQKVVDKLYYEKMHYEELTNGTTDIWNFNQWVRFVGLHSYLQARNLYMSYSETYLKQQSVAPEITAFLLDNWQHSKSQGTDTSYDKWYECKGYKLVHPKFN